MHILIRKFLNKMKIIFKKKLSVFESDSTTKKHLKIFLNKIKNNILKNSLSVHVCISLSLLLKNLSSYMEEKEKKNGGTHGLIQN